MDRIRFAYPAHNVKQMMRRKLHRGHQIVYPGQLNAIYFINITRAFAKSKTKSTNTVDNVINDYYSAQMYERNSFLDDTISVYAEAAHTPTLWNPISMLAMINYR
jgi:hypothetical protein